MSRRENSDDLKRSITRSMVPKGCHCLESWTVCHCRKKRIGMPPIDTGDEKFVLLCKRFSWCFSSILLFLIVCFVSFNVALYCLGYHREFCGFTPFLPRFSMFDSSPDDASYHGGDLDKFENLLKNLQIRLTALESDKKSSSASVEVLTNSLKQIETEISSSRNEIGSQIKNEVKIFDSKIVDEMKTFDSVVNEHFKLLQSSLLDVESEQLKWNEKLFDLTSAMDKEREILIHLRQNVESLNVPNCSQCTSLMVPNKVNALDILSKDAVDGLITTAIEKYDADKTGLADYALESSGGSILSIRCTETYSYWTRQLQVWNFPLYWGRYSPRMVITAGITPGECWAFKGSTGYLVIKLAGVIQIDAISYEHIPKSIAPDGHINSAPKQFEVFGLMTENDEQAAYLGKFTYDKDGSPLQYFPIQVKSPPVPIIELKFLSNHGFPEYTCLYRFRVHGKRV